MLTIGCRKSDRDNNQLDECESPIHLGQLFILEESIEQGIVYKPFNNIIFENNEGDTLIFEVNYQDTLRYIDRGFSYPCPVDTTRDVLIEYEQNFASLTLSKIRSDLNTSINSIKFTLSTYVNESDPKLGLFGDFLLVNVSFKYSETSSKTIGLSLFPVNLRTHSSSIEETEYMVYFEEIEINNEPYMNVFASNDLDGEEVRMFYTLEDGIILLEESNGEKWYHAGNE